MNKDQENKWFWIIGFNYFNIMDMLLTILVIQRLGGEELSPVMRYILSHGDLIFITVKLLGGTVFTGLLLYYKRYTILKYITYSFGFIVFLHLIQLVFAGLILL